MRRRMAGRNLNFLAKVRNTSDLVCVGPDRHA